VQHSLKVDFGLKDVSVNDWSHSDVGSEFHVDGPTTEKPRDRNTPSLWLEQPDLHVQTNVHSDGQDSRILVGKWSTSRWVRRHADS